MSWQIRYGDVEVDSDDFTIEELGEVESVSGVPWSIANPLREIKVAKAFLAVALVRAGTPERELAEALSKLTLKQLKTAFSWTPDTEEEGEEEPDPSDRRRPPTSRSSSPGEPDGDGSPVT